MITLGMILGSMVKDNPAIVIMATGKLEVGKPVEPTGIKLGNIEGKQVIILTI